MRLSLHALFDSICKKICVVSLALMAVLTFVDVFGRVVFNSPLGFTYELVGILLAVAFYSGLYHVSSKRMHVTIDLFDKWLSGRIGFIVSWFSYLFEVMFFLCVVVMVSKQAEELYRFGETFMFLGIEKWIVVSGISVLAWIALVSVIITSPEYRSYLLEDDDQCEREPHHGSIADGKGISS